MKRNNTTKNTAAQQARILYLMMQVNYIGMPRKSGSASGLISLRHGTTETRKSGPASGLISLRHETT